MQAKILTVFVTIKNNVRNVYSGSISKMLDAIRLQTNVKSTMTKQDNATVVTPAILQLMENALQLTNFAN